MTFSPDGRHFGYQRKKWCIMMEKRVNYEAIGKQSLVFNTNGAIRCMFKAATKVCGVDHMLGSVYHIGNEFTHFHRGTSCYTRIGGKWRVSDGRINVL